MRPGRLLGGGKGATTGALLWAGAIVGPLAASWHDTVFRNAEKHYAVTNLSHNNSRLWRVASGLILVFGLLAAAIVYLTAPPQIGANGGDHAAGTAAYSIVPRDSKQYFSDVQNVGGKPALLADDLNWWLADLWHGRRLAYTMAALTIIFALTCFVAGHALSRLPSTNRLESKDS